MKIKKEEPRDQPLRSVQVERVREQFARGQAAKKGRGRGAIKILLDFHRAAHASFHHI